MKLYVWALLVGGLSVVAGVDGVLGQGSPPPQVELKQNYPNPFNFETILPFTIPERMHVRLEVANVLGAIVQTLIDEPMERGFHEIVFDATGLASGIYFYRLITEEKVLTEKMILVR